MKIEKRGKYPGVKVHLEPEECEAFLGLAKDVELGMGLLQPTTPSYFTVALKIGKKMKKIAADDPTFLTERTPEQIEAALLKDKQKIEQQLQAGIANGAWKQVD
jgi:hypothetical protein